MTVTVENCMAQDPVGPHLSEREIGGSQGMAAE